MPRAVGDSFKTPMSLILRLREGKDDDWRRFHGIYGPVVFQLARRSGLRNEDAEDVVAGVMTILLKRFRDGLVVDHAKGRFRDYLGKVTQRQAADLRRKLAKERSEHQSESGDARLETGSTQDHRLETGATQEELAELERLERLRLCLQMLHTDKQIRKRDLRAFQEYALEERPAAGVARKYGVTVGRVYDIKSKTLHRIRAMLAQLDVELGEV